MCTKLNDEDLRSAIIEYRSKAHDFFSFAKENFDFAITAGTYSESENTINYDYTVSIPETVEPGENATIITTIDIGGNHNIRTGKISYKITYTAGETTKNIIYTINVV